MNNFQLIEQAEIINKAHRLTPKIQYQSPLKGGCIIQRWQGFLGEYIVPKLTYPIIAVISGGKAKIKRIRDNQQLSGDHAMPGDIAIIPRNQTMSWRVNGEMDIITLTFADDGICNLLQNIYERLSDTKTHPMYVGAFTNSYLFTNSNHLTNVLCEKGALENKDSTQDEYIEAHLHTISLYIAQYFGRKDDGLSEFQLHSRLVKYTVQRISLGISSKIQIEDIASELRISPALLTKRFKQEMGVSPHNFLLLKRIQKAQNLLANSQMDIATIAIECGFTHQSHLTRNFTKITGLSPFKFRQKSKKND